MKVSKPLAIMGGFSAAIFALLGIAVLIALSASVTEKPPTSYRSVASNRATSPLRTKEVKVNVDLLWRGECLLLGLGADYRPKQKGDG